ncbi:urea ABC transporter substrate-binding protein [Halosimplex pelagicum]|uniref:Urea ABC transporter substrate-binding protein n=1 Tax=Halosimplex pelagicum TaxID=869886 RepID=A0A7D5P4N4_9EURY|nr:urea ABC transporter substrate-binding protein [Halosimplex pelagicum]QLH80743.1 urea ABC transporter substrate-binding protein [Halosimplex pelagicum]
MISGADESDDPITIAVLENRSGKFAELGTSKWQASLLAVEELNENGGILGREIEVVDPDPKSDVDRYRRLVTDILNEEDPDAIWAGYASSEREVVRPLTNAHRQLYFYTTQYEGGVCDRYTFPMGATARQQLGTVLPYLVSEYGPEIYTIAADYNFGHLSSDWVDILAAEHGAEVVGKEFAPLSQTSFESVVSRIEDADPDVVMSMLVGDNHAEFFREKAERGLSIPVGTSTSMAQAFEHKRYEPPAFSDVHVGVNYMEELSTPENERFVERFYEKFPEAEYINQEAQNSYVSIHLYAKAVEAAGTTDQAAVIDQLRSGLSFDAPEGTVTLDGATHHISHNMRIARADENHDIEFFGAERTEETFLSETVGCDLREAAETTQYRPALFHQQGTFDSMHDSLQTRVQEAYESRELRERVEARAEEYSEIMSDCADGDLTARLPRDAENDAMGEIATAFNAMLDEIEEAMRHLQEFSHDVAAASQQASSGAQEVKRASEEVGESIEGVTRRADRQRERLDRVSSEMNNLSATVEEVASTAQTVAQLSEDTAEIGRDGESTAKQASAEMERIRTEVSSVVESVERLDEQMARIDEIVELISEIADQTNILALNANIEAARVGGSDGTDAGGGFAVVADEVKQLAEKTQDSAGDISDLIEEVQGRTTTTVERIRTAEREIEGTTESVEDAVDAFVDVVENVEETDEGVQEITRAVDDQAGSAEEVLSAVNEVAELGDDTAGAAEDASAAAEEQAVSMRQVTSNVESLAAQANRLQTRLDTFDVRRE